MKPTGRIALLKVAFLLLAHTAHADFEFVIEQHLSLENAGVLYEGYEGESTGQVPTTIYGENITTPSSEWTVHFLKPFTNDIPAERGVYVLWRNEPDQTPEDGPETDFLEQGGNFEMVHASIPAGSGPTTITFPELPALGTDEAVAGDYGLFVFELPETKSFYDPETDATVEEPYTDEDFLTWFKWTYGVSDEYGGDYPEIFDPVGVKDFAFVYIATEAPVCCSSVVFLPGIKGSVLKHSSDTLWPPSVLSNDVPQLALDENGESVNDITVDGLLNSFYGTPIYGPFSSFMDDLVTEGVVEEWLPIPYDWRFMPEQILDDGVVTPSGVVGVLEEITELASSSPSGKVILVAHSMGGLMGKAIIRRLEETGEDNLIEAFIMVGSPQLGTPQSIASILHGDEEGIAAGFIVDASEVRQLALNLPSTYSLLPSRAYYDAVSTPTIVFDPDASFTEEWRARWGDQIDAYDAYAEFLTGQGVSRQTPSENTLRIPEIADSELLDGAKQLHALYDEYTFPEHIRVVQVAGWGLPTVKATEYRTNHFFQSYETLFTREGDSTVVYPSAVSSDADETYYFDLFKLSKVLGAGTQHRDLLSATPLQTVVESVIEGTEIAENTYLSSSKPTLDNLDDQLLVSTHSPVVLGAYDQSGNFTGINPDQDSSSGILLISEEIPGSSFLYSSEAQYIFLPEDGEYTFVYKGTGSGPTTVSVQRLSRDTTTAITQYSDISTTEQTSATFVIDTGAPEGAVLEVDLDGNGVVDTTVSPDNESISSGDESVRSGGGNRTRKGIETGLSTQERVAAEVSSVVFAAEVQRLLESLKARLQSGNVDAAALASMAQQVKLLIQVQRLIEMLNKIETSV